MLASLPSTGQAEALPYCERLPLDPEFPAGITGEYDAVGRNGTSDRPYTARLTVSLGETCYALRRTEAGGKVAKGEAWIARCGADGIPALMLQYPGEEGMCALGNDGNNYYRITCLTRASVGAPEGVEAWFQKP